MPEDKTVQLYLRRRVVSPEKSPEAAHHFVWTRVKEEVLLEVGFMDLTEASLVAKGIIPEDESNLFLYITHRFTLNQEAQERLFKAVDELRESIGKAESVQQPQTSETDEDADA